MYRNFKQQDPEKFEIGFIERSRTEELCEWTNKVIIFYLFILSSSFKLNFFVYDKILVYLPSVIDAPESSDGQTHLVTHFNSIKVNECMNVFFFKKIFEQVFFIEIL